MAEKKVRIRKAPTLREQAEAAHTKTELKAVSPKLPSHKLLGLGIIPKIGQLLTVIFRPLRVILKPFRWLMPIYFVNSWREVKQVTWPNRRETWRLTLAVFIFAVVFGSLIAGVDKVLDELFKRVILKQ